jgi:hypothetical protein
LIKIQYLADMPEEKRQRYCDGCNAETADNSVYIAFHRHKNFFWTSVTLCDKCRRELYEKI